MRKVSGLRWARPMVGRPEFLPSIRASHGSKGEGIRYERALAKGLGSKFQCGLWWEFRDDNGMGVCQTDFFGKARDWLIILETKLTWTVEAEEQLYELYVPVVAMAMKVPRSQILPIVVCKYLTRGASRPIVDTLRESLQEAMKISPPFCPVWHHIGGVPQLREMMYA